jgi:phosphoglycerol transferase MdoB-like AlkP superfamily enzyme
MQLTFLAGLIQIVALAISIFMGKKKTAIAVVVSLIITIGLLAYYLYLVHCVQEGKCNVLAYVLSSLILVNSVLVIVIALIPSMKDVSYKMTSVKENSGIVEPMSMKMADKIMSNRSLRPKLKKSKTSKSSR